MTDVGDPNQPSDQGQRVARAPEYLAELLLERMNAGDVDGVVALYEPTAVLALPTGALARGTDAIRAFYLNLLAARPQFTPGEQAPALRSGSLALTSTRLPNGDVTAEVARRQPDGSWRWLLDRPSLLGTRPTREPRD